MANSKKLLWVTFLFVDTDLHKTSRIEVLKGLSKQGYDVTLLAAYSKTKPSPKKTGFRVISIPVRRVPVLPLLVLSASLIILLPILIIKLRPDFIVAEPHSGTFLGLLSARAIPRFIRPTIVMDIRSTPVETRGLVDWFDTMCFHAAIFVARRLLDGITTITNMMRQEICTKYHVNPDSVGVWTSGVSTNMFAPKAYLAKAKKLRATMGLNDKFVVLYHGVLSPNRGVAQAIVSMKLLKGKYRAVALLILGKGPALQDLMAASQRGSSENRVIFHKPVDYEVVPQFISACDIGIVPLPDMVYWRSQCALNLLECLAMAKVVVATDIPANREVTGESKCVIYAASAEAEDIANAIMHAFDNRGQLDKWGASGRALMIEKYAWTKVANNLDRYLSSRRYASCHRTSVKSDLRT